MAGVKWGIYNGEWGIGGFEDPFDMNTMLLWKFSLNLVPDVTNGINENNFLTRLQRFYQKFFT